MAPRGLSPHHIMRKNPSTLGRSVRPGWEVYLPPTPLLLDTLGGPPAKSSKPSFKTPKPNHFSKQGAPKPRTPSRSPAVWATLGSWPGTGSVIGSTISGPGSTVSGPGSALCGLGSIVSGLGSAVSGLGSAVSGLGSTVSGLGYTVSALGFAAQDPRPQS